MTAEDARGAGAAPVAPAAAAAVAGARTAVPPAAQDMFLAAAEAMSDGLAVFDADDRLVYVNSRLPALFTPNLSAAIRIGELFPDILRRALADGPLYHPDMGEDFLERRQALHRAARSEHEQHLPDGRWVRVRENAIPDGGRVLLVADITAEKTAEAALRASEERFRDIVESASDWVWETDADHRFTFISEQVRELSGEAKEDVLGRRRLDMRLPDDGDEAAWARHDADLAARRPFRDFVFAYADHEGRRRFCRVHGKPFFAPDGAFLGYRGTGSDLTAERRAEQALRESRARLAAFMTHAPVGMYLKEAGGRYIMANPEMAKVFGRPVQEIIGRTAAEVFPADEAAMIRDSDAETLLTGGATHREEYLAGHDAYAWSLVIRFPIRDAAGRISHIGGFDLDITAQKDAERRLRESEQRFRRLAEAHPVPLAVLAAADGRFAFASPPCAALLGVEAGALAGADLAGFTEAPADAARLMADLRAAGALHGVEVGLRAADGRPFWAAIDARLIDLEGQAVAVTAITDLTRRREAEAEIERQRQALNQSEKLAALGSLLAGVAHELNNPLSVVNGQAAMLQETAPDRQVRERAGRIKAAADRCIRIVKTFLAMARSRPVEQGPLQLNAVVDGAVEIVAYGLRTSGIEIALSLDPALPQIFGSADQLSQVVLNLLVNAQQALQAVPQPRIVRVETARDGDTVRLSVADNGSGVPPELRRKVFEPFFTTKPLGVGTGVGLSVCHAIVTAHDGDIDVEAAPGGGAAFVVRLPAFVAGGAATEALVAAGPPAAAEPAVGRSRILVVDDEPDIAEMLSEVLSLAGHEVAVAGSGREALAWLAEHRADLIVSDLRMPDIDGRALYRALQSRHPALTRRILFVTGDSLAADLAGFLAETGVPVIEKPFDLRDVVGRVRDHLAADA